MALAEIGSSIAGTWVLVKNENLDDYLKEIGVNFVLRKLAAASSTMIISVEDDYVRIVTKGPKDSDHKFKLGEEVESNDPQDNPMKAIVTWENGKLITAANPTEGSKAKATRVERRIEGRTVDNGCFCKCCNDEKNMEEKKLNVQTFYASID